MNEIRMKYVCIKNLKKEEIRIIAGGEGTCICQTLPLPDERLGKLRQWDYGFHSAWRAQNEKECWNVCRDRGIYPDGTIGHFVVESKEDYDQKKSFRSAGHGIVGTKVGFW